MKPSTPIKMTNISALPKSFVMPLFNPSPLHLLGQLHIGFLSLLTKKLRHVSRISCRWNPVMILFGIWLLSIHMITLTPIHNTVRINSSFLFIVEVRTCQHGLIHSAVDGHLNCFQFLAVTNKGAMNIHVQVFAWMYVFFSLL